MSSPPCATVRRAGTTPTSPCVQRAMRRLTTRAVIAVCATALTLEACLGQAPPTVAPPGEPSGWSILPRGPLSARHGALAVWTGVEVLILGGRDTPPCPPNADCAPPPEPALRDGAALDLTTGRWRAMADAPRPIEHAVGAVAGDSLFLRVADALLRYRFGADRWSELPPPPGDVSGMALTAMGSDLLAYHATQEFGVAPDAVLDVVTETWTSLPVDPLADAHERTMVWTGREIVLLAVPLEARPADEPPLMAAAILDVQATEWRRLPESEILGGATGWAYAGDRVVSAAIGRADGGEVDNWGRAYPYGGMLGPAGVWAELPNPPLRAGGMTGVATGLGEYAVADGWALHVPAGRWTEIQGPPNGATEAATAWTGEELVVWGGVAWNDNRATLLGDGLVWRP